MKNLTKLLLGLFFFALVIEIVIIAPQTLDQNIPLEPEEIEAGEELSKVEQSITGVHLIETKADEKEWELWSESAKSYKKEKDWLLTKVKAKFFGEDGLVFDVVGETGSVNLKSKNMVIEGNVVTKTSNGYTFRTETIKYTSKLRELRSNSVVKMTGPRDATGNRMRLTGETLVVDLNESIMEVQKDVRSERTFKDEKRVSIKSNRAQFSSKSNLARFLDDVVIDFETMRLTGPDAVFKYDASRDMVTSMMVQGGVKVSDLDKWATSEKVDVEFEKEKYVFRGRPRVVQNNDELRGDEIIFYNGGKRVQVKKARAKMKEK